MEPGSPLARTAIRSHLVTAARVGVSRRTRLLTIALVAALHIVAIGALIAAFGVDAVVATVRSVAAFDVPLPPPPPPQPSPQATERAGEAGPPAPKAIPKPAAPKPPIVVKPNRAPPASSKGADNRSGASTAGSGSGLAGEGAGSGAAGGGDGSGGGLASKPSVRSGNLDRAKDFSVPPGGRESRFGKSVTVVFTVTADGRARDCRVASSGVDPQTTAEVCPLVVRKIRFNPATDRAGNPVESRYGYRVDFRPQ